MRKKPPKEVSTAPSRAPCVAFANHKGGTGKTTSCLSIAGYLAKGGSKVLVVDFDPQGNATAGLGIDRKSLTYSMYDAILAYCDGHEGVPLTHVILETDVPGLHVAPAEFDLAVAECYMLESRDRTNLLYSALEMARPLYDYILVDLPPTSGLLTINGLCAGDCVVVPLDPSVYALESLGDLQQSFRDIEECTGRRSTPSRRCSRAYVEADGPGRIPSQEIEASLKAVFHPVFVVPVADEIFQTQKEGVPISHYAPRSGVGKAYEKITKTIRNLAAHIPLANNSQEQSPWRT